MPTNNKTAKRNIDKTMVIVDALQGMMTRRRQQAYKKATADADAADASGSGMRRTRRRLGRDDVAAANPEASAAGETVAAPARPENAASINAPSPASAAAAHLNDDRDDAPVVMAAANPEF